MLTACACNLKKLPIPEYWEYTDVWCEENIDMKYDLDNLCRHSEASFEIPYFIYKYGEIIHTNIKWLNEKIDIVNNGEFDKYTASQMENFIDSIEYQNDHGYKWEQLVDLELRLKMVNYNLLPSEILRVVNGVLALLKNGSNLYKKSISCLEDVLEHKLHQEQEDMEAEDRQRDREEEELSRWEKIELNHVKIKEGFVYILSNPLMKGVFKIGFTARNPDMRAAELSKRIALPLPFEVYKYWRTKDPYMVEQRVHSKLSQYLTAGEYFNGDPELFSRVIEELVIN